MNYKISGIDCFCPNIVRTGRNSYLLYIFLSKTIKYNVDQFYSTLEACSFSRKKRLEKKKTSAQMDGGWILSELESAGLATVGPSKSQTKVSGRPDG